MKQRKHSVIVTTAIVLFIFSVVSSFAHSGRTDSKGGHYDRSAGEYHYHHGMSAHQHPNGVCPYAVDETTTKQKYTFSDSENFTEESDDAKSKFEYVKTNYEFLGKLSDTHEWHISDVIHLVVSASLPFVIFIFCTDVKFRKFRRFGDLLFTLLMSLALCGYSLTLIFPYGLDGLDFLWRWVANGLIVPVIVLIQAMIPLYFIYLLLSCLNFDNKNNKGENK